MLRARSFRYCMMIGATALGGVGIFYLGYYGMIIRVALGNSGITPFLADSMRAMWLTFACQSLLIAGLYAMVAWRPRAVSREVIILFGLLQLVEAVLLFAFAGSMVVAMLLVSASVFVLAGAVLWPQAAAQATPSAPSASNSLPTV